MVHHACCETNKCAYLIANSDCICMLDGDMIFYENCPKECSHIVLTNILGRVRLLYLNIV